MNRDFRIMATDNITYNSWRFYFRDIAISNKLILHSDTPGMVRFQSSTIDIFISQTFNLMDPAHDKCILYHIRNTREVKAVQNGVKEDLRLMFFVLNSCENGNIESEAEAIDRAERCLNQILAKFTYDSKNNHPIWDRSMDQLDGIRISPYEIDGQVRYVGFQVSVQSIQNWNKCYNSNDWNP